MKKRNEFFYIVFCVINTVIPIIDLLKKAKISREYFSDLRGRVIDYNIMLPIHSFFSIWICGINENGYAHIYFVILAFTSLAFWWVCTTKKNIINSLDNMPIKYYAYSFLLTGGASLFPLLLNIMGISLFFPYIKPDSAYDVFWGIFSNNIIGECFYQFPIIYLLLYLFLVFAFWGLIGSIEFGLLTSIKHKIIPLLCIGCALGLVQFAQHIQKPNVDYSPLSVFCSYRCIYDALGIVLLEMSILLLIVFMLLYKAIKRRKKRERSIRKNKQMSGEA